MKLSLASVLLVPAAAAFTVPSAAFVARRAPSARISALRYKDVHLDSLSENCDMDIPAAECDDAIADYLKATTSMGPMTTLDAMGEGVPSYLDSAVSEACGADGAVPADCAPAIASYLEAVSGGQAVPTTVATAALATYLDGLGERDGGANSAEGAVIRYLSALADGSVDSPTAADVQSYLEDVDAGKVAPAGYQGFELFGVRTTAFADLAPMDGKFGEPCDMNDPTPECVAAIEDYRRAVSADPTVAIGDGAPTFPDSALSEMCVQGVAPKVLAPHLATYLAALSGGSAVPTTVATSALTTYLDSLCAAAPKNDVNTFVKAVQQTFDGFLEAISGGLDPEKKGKAASSSATTEVVKVGTSAAVVRYLSALSDGSVPPPSADAVLVYLEGLSTGEAKAPRAGSDLSAFLESLE